MTVPLSISGLLLTVSQFNFITATAVSITLLALSSVSSVPNGSATLAAILQHLT